MGKQVVADLVLHLACHGGCVLGRRRGEGVAILLDLLVGSLAVEDNFGLLKVPTRI